MSVYMQRVKRHGHVGYPEDYVKDKYQTAPLLKYHSYTKKMETVFGSGNVLPIGYEQSKDHEKGIVGDFLSRILGFAPNWVETEKVVNVSPSPVELKLLLLANLYSPRPKLSDYIVEDSVLAGRSTSFKGHALISNELARDVLDYYAVENSKLFKNYNVAFPAYQEKDYCDIKDVVIPSEDMASILMGLIVRLDKELSRLR